MTPSVQSLYELYFGRIIIRNVSWAPSQTCKVCATALINWSNRKRKLMPFRIPMTWSDPGGHQEDNCYVCANRIWGLNRKKRASKSYTGVPSAQLPELFEQNDVGPKPPSPTLVTDITGLEAASCSDHDQSYAPSNQTPERGILGQAHVDRIARNLNLSQKQTMKLVQELKAENVLDRSVRMTASYRNRQARFSPYFRRSDDNTQAYCIDIAGLMQEKNIDYNAGQWRLFIDSSKSALKAVLLYIDNTKKPVPLFYAVGMKETYESMQSILVTVKYDEHKWRISGDLKVIALLTGMQAGYTKYCCFLCLWDSRYKGNQYQRKVWPERTTHQSGRENIAHPALVPMDNILLPPLHIKLGIVKNFVKCLNKNSQSYAIVRSIFPRLSEAKVKEG